MRYKVIQWATGYTGAFSLKYVINNPGLELVGVKCFSASKEGVDAGTIVGLPPVGIKATQDAAALLALDADCVLYMPGDTALTDASEEGSVSQALFKGILPILASGKNVVTPLTSCIGLEFNGAAGQRCLDELEAACKKGHSTFFATGIEPGFLGDVLPLCLASTCAEVHSIRSYEILDYSEYDKLATLQAVGLCVNPATLAGRPASALLSVWRSVPSYVARGLGVKLDEVRVMADVRLAEETFLTPRGITVEKGTTAGLRFAVEGLIDGDPLIAIEHISRMRSDIAPEWPQLLPAGGYRIELAGSNPVKADFHMGLASGNGNAFADAMAGTAARAVNAVPFVCDATPGVKTFFDLPMITGLHSFKRGGQRR